MIYNVFLPLVPLYNAGVIRVTWTESLDGWMV